MQKNTNWVTIFFKKFIINLATIFSLGNLFKFPEIIGAILGLLFYLFFFPKKFLNQIIFLVISFYAGRFICHYYLKMRQNSKELILDKILAMPYCFIGSFTNCLYFKTISQNKLIFLSIIIFILISRYQTLKINKYDYEKIVFYNIIYGLLTCMIIHIYLLFFLIKKF